MKLGEIAEKLELERLTPLFDREVTGVYISDKLSDVIANAKGGDLLVTGQINANALAAAGLVELSAILIAQGKPPDPELIRKAEKAELSILATALSRAQVAAKLYEAGIR